MLSYTADVQLLSPSPSPSPSLSLSHTHTTGYLADFKSSQSPPSPVESFGPSDVYSEGRVGIRQSPVAEREVIQPPSYCKTLQGCATKGAILAIFFKVVVAE